MSMTLAQLQQLAAPQHSVLLGSQLRAAGVAARVERRMVRSGWLVEAMPGAYVTGAAGPSQWQRAVACCLLAGEGSALSHTTAAKIHRIPHVVAGDRIEISIPRLRHPRIRGAIAHRVGPLPPEDVVRVRGIPVTSPARTIVDLAPRFSSLLARRMVDDGFAGGLWTIHDLQGALARAGSKPGVRMLRVLLDERGDDPPAEGGLEGRVGAALASFSPFETQYQLILAGNLLVLDIAWPPLLVAVECDGWTLRSRSRGKFDADRRRDNLLALHGWTVIHLTTAMSDDEMRAAVFPVLLRAAAKGAR